MQGSKVRLWKQDPSVNAIGVRTAYIHTRVRTGPKDDEVQILGAPQVSANSNQDYLFDPSENPLEFDAIHTFSVVRQVLTMYQRAFSRIGLTGRAQWQWGDAAPIRVYPRAGNDANAYYSRSERSLRFFYFDSQVDPTLPRVYTCRSFDIVAHETGHAILDGLRPGYWSSSYSQTGGLHESFGDLTAIFTMLAQLDQCEAIIAESKSDLHAKSFFPKVAEQFGEALGRETGLRNADNDLKLSEVGLEVHGLSQVFTGAVYDILADIFDDYKKLDSQDPAETLFRVGKHVLSVVLIALARGPEQNATYSDIAKQMVSVEPIAAYKRFIRERFKEREIMGAGFGLAAAKPEPLDWHRCCGTLRHPDHVRDALAALEKG